MVRELLALSKYVHFKIKDVDITNFAFKLHYRATTWMLLAATAIVCMHQYIGQKIECTHSDILDESKAKIEHIMSSYCFFMNLFTVDKYHNTSYVKGKKGCEGEPMAAHVAVLNSFFPLAIVPHDSEIYHLYSPPGLASVTPHIREAAHPGVGAYAGGNDPAVPVTYLKWYQWVPYVLLLQALSFYVPYFIWRHQEKNNLSGLCKSMNLMQVLEKDEEDKEIMYQEAAKSYFERLRYLSSWCYWLFICELLNALNVILQFYLTDLFLNNKFFTLGSDVYNNIDNELYNPLDEAFPKVAKCTFTKFGPSGSLQIHDLICVLSLNIANEKIYLILWWWYIFLAVISFAIVLQRIVFSLLISRQVLYKIKSSLSSLMASMSKDDFERTYKPIYKNMNYCQWMYLQYLISNLDGVVAVGFIKELIKEYKQREKSDPLLKP